MTNWLGCENHWLILELWTRRGGRLGTNNQIGHVCFCSVNDWEWKFSSQKETRATSSTRIESSRENNKPECLLASSLVRLFFRLFPNCTAIRSNYIITCGLESHYGGKLVAQKAGRQAAENDNKNSVSYGFIQLGGEQLSFEIFTLNQSVYLCIYNQTSRPKKSAKPKSKLLERTPLPLF